MTRAKPSRRRAPQKLEPIDWREFANDAVLNGNMSTLYHRPPDEDPTAYASEEALIEIEKRAAASQRLRSPEVVDTEPDTSAESHLPGPTVGTRPTVGLVPTVALMPDAEPEMRPDPEQFRRAARRRGTRKGVSSARQVETGEAGIPNQRVEQVDTNVAPNNVTAAPVDNEATVKITPTVGLIPTVGPEPTVGIERRTSPALAQPTESGSGASAATHNKGPMAIGRTMGRHTVGVGPTVGLRPPDPSSAVGVRPTVGTGPTVGMSGSERKVKPIRDVQDALTLAGQILYKAMYGAPEGGRSKICAKGYRQLAAETHLNKDTVRDLISEFKDKAMVREVGTYNPDTRSAKTYEVLSYKAILQVWRDAGILFVTAGRQRPTFCDGIGAPISAVVPTVGARPTVGVRPTVGLEVVPPTASAPVETPTVGLEPTVGAELAADGGDATAYSSSRISVAEVIQAMQQITGSPVDQDAAERLIRKCQEEAPDCTTDEIVEFAWSKSFLCRSGKIANPVGFLITQVPKHFQPQSITVYRDRKAKELEAAEAAAAHDAMRQQAADQELAERERVEASRTAVAERHRTPEGIDVQAVLNDPESDDELQQWAKRLLKVGKRYPSSY